MKKSVIQVAMGVLVLVIAFLVIEGIKTHKARKAQTQQAPQPTVVEDESVVSV